MRQLDVQVKRVVWAKDRNMGTCSIQIIMKPMRMEQTVNGENRIQNKSKGSKFHRKLFK